MDWLYPVYQKIVIWSKGKEFNNLDNYTKMLLHIQESECASILINGEDISSLFKEIVEWIKIYNLKVSEDGK